MVRKSYVYFILLQQAWTKKSSLMFVDTNVKSLESIQLDTIGASSAAPSPQIETTPEKVLYLLILLIFEQFVIS